MVARHDALEPGVLAVIFNDLVAGGHIGGGKALAHGRAKGHMPHHGNVVDKGERFAGVTAGTHTRGNDGNDVHLTAPCGLNNLCA